MTIPILNKLFLILEFHRCLFYEESFQHITMMNPLVNYHIDIEKRIIPSIIGTNVLKLIPLSCKSPYNTFTVAQ